MQLMKQKPYVRNLLCTPLCASNASHQEGKMLSEKLLGSLSSRT